MKRPKTVIAVAAMGVVLLGIGIALLPAKGILCFSGSFLIVIGLLLVLFSSLIGAKIRYGNPPRAGYHQGQLVRYGESPTVPFDSWGRCPYCGTSIAAVTRVCPSCGKTI